MLILSSQIMWKNELWTELVNLLKLRANFFIVRVVDTYLHLERASVKFSDEKRFLKQQALIELKPITGST